jgi:hypothetical protein
MTAARTLGFSLMYCPWELQGQSGVFPLPLSGQARDMCPSLRQRKHLPSFISLVRSSSVSFPVVRMASMSIVFGSFCRLGGEGFW